MIIQNALCVPFYLHKDNYRFSLDNEKIRNRKINGILGLSSEGDQLVANPFNENELLSSSQDIINLSMFLNLTDDKKKLFIKNLDLRNIVSPPEASDYLEIFLNKHIDLENSFISYKNYSNQNDALILLYIFYQTRPFNKYSDLVNGSFTISMQPTEPSHKFKLSDYVDRTLADKPIKRIITQMNYDDLNCGYLDIVGKNGERLEMLPLVYLNDYRSKQILFDGIKIDFEKSFCISDYYYNGDEYPITLTFIY